MMQNIFCFVAIIQNNNSIIKSRQGSSAFSPTFLLYLLEICAPQTELGAGPHDGALAISKWHYKVEPDHAAGTYHVSVNYILMCYPPCRILCQRLLCRGLNQFQTEVGYNKSFPGFIYESLVLKSPEAVSKFSLFSVDICICFSCKI